MSSMMVTRDLSYVSKLRIRHPPPPITYRRIRSGLYSYLRSVEKSSATYCLAIELIQSRYGAEMSAVPNRRICSTVDSSIFTPNLSRTAFFAAIMHWFTPSFSVQHRLSCAFLLLIYRMFMVPFPISARRLVPLKFPRWFTIAGYPCG